MQKKQNGYSLLFRPAMPFLLENGDKIFFRPTIPFISKLPVFQNDGFNNKSGIGNISFDFTYAPKSTGSFIYSFGAAGSLPTATNDSLGNKKTTLGPEFFVGKKTKKYIVGMFPNHQWDIAGPGDEDISRISSQIFAVLFLGGGWSYGTAPTFTYDWVSKEWTVPISATVNKTVILSGRPWRFGIELNYYVEQPDAFGPEWEISINITPVVENILAKWFK